MALSNREVANEVFHSQSHIWNHTFNFINSMSLNCAIQLGIPDVINKHGRPMTLPELVVALPINQTKSHSVYRLMRLLVHSGFFVIQKMSGIDDEQEEGYLLTPASRLLLKDEPLSITPFLLAMLDPILIKPWHFMSEWFKNEDPTPFGTAHGMSLWDYAGHEQKLNNFFNDAMASDARLVTSVVIRECKEVFEGLNSIVDVGGGTGTAAKFIVQGFPHLKCTVLDLPHVVADLKVSKNLSYVAGDMFQAIPPADAVLLKTQLREKQWILHDWSDEESLIILQKCKEAIPSTENGGKVIIIDMILQNQKNGDELESNETQLFFDMLMMVVVHGKERNEKEWAKLFFDAGFSDYKITHTLGIRSLIEVYP